MTQSQLKRDYLRLIRHSVEYWNLWRDYHPDTKPDLAGLDFSKENLDGINLSEAHLKDCKFTKLRSANLSGARFSTAALAGADLSEANLQKRIVQ